MQFNFSVINLKNGNELFLSATVSNPWCGITCCPSTICLFCCEKKNQNHWCHNHPRLYLALRHFWIFSLVAQLCNYRTDLGFKDTLVELQKQDAYQGVGLQTHTLEHFYLHLPFIYMHSYAQP